MFGTFCVLTLCEGAFRDINSSDVGRLSEEWKISHQMAVNHFLDVYFLNDLMQTF